MTDREVEYYCKGIKEIRLGGMPFKGGSILTQLLFDEFAIEASILIRKIGFDNYVKYIKSWELGVRDYTLTRHQIEIIKRRL